jgi:hypothetical protein
MLLETQQRKQTVVPSIVLECIFGQQYPSPCEVSAILTERAPSVLLSEGGSPGLARLRCDVDGVKGRDQESDCGFENGGEEEKLHVL